jgi:hypothetical protein
MGPRDMDCIESQHAGLHNAIKLGRPLLVRRRFSIILCYNFRDFMHMRNEHSKYGTRQLDEKNISLVAQKKVNYYLRGRSV